MVAVVGGVSSKEESPSILLSKTARMAQEVSTKVALHTIHTAASPTSGKLQVRPEGSLLLKDGDVLGARLGCSYISNWNIDLNLFLS